MDLIVAVCRALANRNRLRLLRVIHAQPGTTAHALATTTALPAESVSKHLKLLGSFHLVSATPQGRYVRYAPPSPRSTSHPFLRDIQALLHGLFGSTQSNSTLGQVWNRTPPPLEEAEEELLMKLFTTYTHLRRLLILRYLARSGACTAEQVADSVRMSNPAVNRHLHKLRRRAVVSATEVPPVLWKLARPAGFACRQQLLDSVLRSLKAEGHPSVG